MEATILAASSSEYRRWWYRHRLSREGFVVSIATDALDCIAQLQKEMHDFLILETPLQRGGADSVLDMLTLEPARGDPRVLLVAIKADAGEMYRICRYAVDDVLSREELEHQLVNHLHRFLRRTEDLVPVRRHRHAD